MFRKLAIVLAAAALVLTTTGVAWAADDDDDEGFIGVGARFAWDNYKTPMLSYSGMDPAPAKASLEYGGPNLGGAFHWGVTNRLVLTASLDFGYFNHTIYPYPEEGSKDIRSVTSSFLQFGAMIGVKFYFKEPAPGGVSLYLTGGVGAYFASATSTAKVRTNRNAMKNDFYDDPCVYVTCDGDDPVDEDGDEYDDVDDAWDDYIEDDGEDDWEDAGDDDKDAQKAIDKELEMVGDLASPFVFQVAIGAEFFANETFSIGADILGIRFAYASSDVGKVKNTDMSNAEWTGEQSYLNLYVYSALTMSFNLTADAGSTPAAGEGEGDEGWGQKEEGSGDGWGGGGEEQGGGWGTNTGWSTGPAAPAPAPTPAPAPAPAPAPEPAPTPDPGGGGWDSQPPPPPPPPPPGY